jgi:hypothetical protein
MSFLEVITDVVSASGRRTAATSTAWQGWALQAAEAMRDGPEAAGNGVVRAAGEAYVMDWAQRLHRVAADADGVGTMTTSASNLVDNTDGDSATLLAGQGATIAVDGSYLRRTISYS